MSFKIEKFGDRTICIGGVGIMFHQDGFPLGIAAKQLQDKGIELSWLHVAKELYFQYASNDRLYTKLVSEIEDANVEGVSVDLELLKEFIYSDYDKQCKLIFNYLFGGSDEAIFWFKHKYENI